MRARRAAVAVVLTGLLAAVIALAGCISGLGGEDMRLLADLGAAGRGEAAGAKRAEIAYVVDGRRRLADLYQPADGGAALVLVPGATPHGKNDSRVVATADALRRAGFRVLVPELGAGPALRLGPSDVVTVADAVIHHGRAPPARGVILVAVSYAVGPALLAALDPAAAPSLRLIVAIGGYYDLVEALTYLTTGCARAGPGQPWTCHPPSTTGKWQFALGNADRLPDPADRGRLAAIAARQLAGDAGGAAALVPGLGPGGRAVYALLVNADPNAVPGLVARLPASLRADLFALDLRRHDLSRLSAPVLLVHGQDDPIIPAPHSVALAQAIGARAELYLPDRLAHMALGPDAADLALLRRAAQRLLAERDRMQRP